MKAKLFGTFIILSTLVFIGAGCSSQIVSTLSEDEAAAALTLTPGSEIILRPTVLGVSGKIAEWLGSSTDNRDISITSWQPGETVGLSWQVVSQVETEESKARQAEYDEQYSQTPIGVKIPDRPEREYEEITKSGTVSSTALAESNKLFLPDFWTEGDTEVQEDASLVWISQRSYDELVNTRKTTLSLGMFDESLAEAEQTTEQVKGFFSQLMDLIPDSVLSSGEGENTDGNLSESVMDLTGIEAEGDWGSYTLSVNDVRTKVKVIKAGNAFADLTILANRDNPIILEIKLSPLAQGSLEAINPTNLARSFSGYEIFEINH